LPGFATILSSRPLMLLRWFMTGNKSFSDANTCTHSVSFRNRTDFDLDFEMSVVAWKIRAFSTVCAKFRSRWCKRKYCDSSVDATPSSKRRFNGASRSLAVADGQASLCRIRSACSNSTNDSESDCRRVSNLRIASRQLSTLPKRCSNRAHRSVNAVDAVSSKSRSTSAAAPSSDSVRCWIKSSLEVQPFTLATRLK